MTDTTFREVHVITFEPTEDGGEAIGGLSWRDASEDADALYTEYVKDFGSTNTIAQWTAHVPDEWDRDAITEYLDATFLGDTPDGYPVRVHNEPFENYPHRED